MVIPMLLVQLRKNLDKSLKINWSIFETKENIRKRSHFFKFYIYFLIER